MKSVWLLAVIPVLLSGFFGYLVGGFTAQVGFSANTASTVAGCAGFMGTQLFNFVGMLLTQRYRPVHLRSRIST